MSDDLTPIEKYVLARMYDYGGGVDWGGRGANAAHRKAAVGLIERGLLRGTYRNCSMTCSGVAAHYREAAKAKRAASKAFRVDRREFEK